MTLNLTPAGHEAILKAALDALAAAPDPSGFTATQGAPAHHPGHVGTTGRVGVNALCLFGLSYSAKAPGRGGPFRPATLPEPAPTRPLAPVLA